MDLSVFLAVLAAALCHAGWNASLKLKIDPAIAITLVAVAAGILALPLVPLVGSPHASSWPYLGASLAIHLVYWIALAEAYRNGDLGHVYPIARGAAPLLTATGGALLFAEQTGWKGWSGILLLTSGVILLSLKGGRVAEAFDRRSVGFALLTAVSIASYTLVDGRGARLSANPHGYTVWLFLLDGVMMAVFGWSRQRDGIAKVLPGSAVLALGGGGLSMFSYWVAIWAMTVAPIALVAAVRETSVLFAAAIGVLLLKEPLIPVRVAAGILVLAGLALIRSS